MSVLSAFSVPPCARRSAALLALAAGTACAASAATVVLPTTIGDHPYDSEAFATGYLGGGPGGEFACFSAATVSACSAASLPLSALGPDLTTGLALGVGGTVTLAMPSRGDTLVFWEAGDIAAAADDAATLFSLHTAAGWTPEVAVGSFRLQPVLADPRASGYATNFGSFGAPEFGLKSGTSFDAVRIRSCCGAQANFDLLALAAVPEPVPVVLLLAGLVGLTGLSVRRRPQAASSLP